MGGWHKASVFGCLPLAVPIDLSPLLILTLCGSERVLVVPTEPPDDLSCRGGGGSQLAPKALSHTLRDRRDWVPTFGYLVGGGGEALESCCSPSIDFPPFPQHWTRPSFAEAYPGLGGGGVYARIHVYIVCTSRIRISVFAYTQRMRNEYAYTDMRIHALVHR